MDGLGNPLRVILTAGQAHNSTQAKPLVRDLSPEFLIADKAYDSDGIRNTIADRDMTAVILSNRSRPSLIPYDKDHYKECHLVECFINKIKHFRRIATRYDRSATSFLSMLCLCAAMIWLR